MRYCNRVAFGILAIVVVGCGGGPPVVGCPLRATRCDGELVEACDSRGRWRLVADCADVAQSSGGAWACGTTYEDGREINACLPEVSQ